MNKMILYVIGYYLSFLIDCILKKGYLGTYILNKYLKFSEKSYLTIYFSIFIFNFYLVLILSFFGFTINLIDISPFFSLDVYQYMSENGREIAKVASESSSYNKGTYNVQLDKETVDNGFKALGKLGSDIVGTVIPSIGAFGAGATVGAAVVKSSSGLPIIQRAILGVGTTAVTTFSSVIAHDAAKQVKTDNLRKEIEEVIKTSSHANPDVNTVPSPTDEKFYANSPLESGDIRSPLEHLLLDSFLLDVMILLLILILLLIIFNRYIYVHNSKFITSILDKYIPTKFRNWLNLSIDFNNKFILIMFIIIGFFIIFDSLVNMYISVELYNNIDLYVEEHKYLKTKQN